MAHTLAKNIIINVCLLTKTVTNLMNMNKNVPYVKKDFTFRIISVVLEFNDINMQILVLLNIYIRIKL